MALTYTAILQWMLGNTLAAGERQAISTDFLSKGLDGLVNMTDEDVRDTCSGYAKRTDGVFPIIYLLVISKINASATTARTHCLCKYTPVRK